jgi:hypothetical protein
LTDATSNSAGRAVDWLNAIHAAKEASVIMVIARVIECSPDSSQGNVPIGLKKSSLGGGPFRSNST